MFDLPSNMWANRTLWRRINLNERKATELLPEHFQPGLQNQTRLSVDPGKLQQPADARNESAVGITADPLIQTESRDGDR